MGSSRATDMAAFNEAYSRHGRMPDAIEWLHYTIPFQNYQYFQQVMVIFEATSRSLNAAISSANVEFRTPNADVSTVEEMRTPRLLDDMRRFAIPLLQHVHLRLNVAFYYWREEEEGGDDIEGEIIIPWDDDSIQTVQQQEDQHLPIIIDEVMEITDEDFADIAPVNNELDGIVYIIEDDIEIEEHGLEE